MDNQSAWTTLGLIQGKYYSDIAIDQAVESCGSESLNVQQAAILLKKNCRELLHLRSRLEEAKHSEQLESRILLNGEVSPQVFADECDRLIKTIQMAFGETTVGLDLISHLKRARLQKAPEIPFPKEPEPVVETLQTVSTQRVEMTPDAPKAFRPVPIFEEPVKKIEPQPLQPTPQAEPEIRYVERPSGMTSTGKVITGVTLGVIVAIIAFKGFDQMKLNSELNDTKSKLEASNRAAQNSEEQRKADADARAKIQAEKTEEENRRKKAEEEKKAAEDKLKKIQESAPPPESVEDKLVATAKRVDQPLGSVEGSYSPSELRDHLATKFTEHFAGWECKTEYEEGTYSFVARKGVNQFRMDVSAGSSSGITGAKNYVEKTESRWMGKPETYNYRRLLVDSLPVDGGSGQKEDAYLWIYERNTTEDGRTQNFNCYFHSSGLPVAFAIRTNNLLTNDEEVNKLWSAVKIAK